MDLKELETHVKYIRNDIHDIKKRLEPVERHVFFINTLMKLSLGASGATGAILLIIKAIKG